MNRLTLDAIVSQYKIKEISGTSEVSWENGVHCEIPEVIIKGKAEQTWYEGKNLWDNESAKEISFWEPTIYLSKQLDFPPGQYVFSCKEYKIFGEDVGVSYATAACISEKQGQWSDTGVIYHSTLPDLSRNKFVFEIREGIPMYFNLYPGDKKLLERFLTDIIVDIQIEKGNEATSFEPYVGCVSVPNPRYPIEPIFSDQIKIQAMGKNLINYNQCIFGYELSGATGEILKSNNWYTTNWIPVKPSTTYTLQGTSSITRVESSTESNEGIILVAPGATTKNTFTTNEKTKFVRFNSIINGYNSPQLELGEKATKFEKYFDGGEAVGPELLIANDGTKQSTWDSQTGKGLNWWWDEIVLDGSEIWTVYGINNYKGFSCHGNILPEVMTRNAFWSNQAIHLTGVDNATKQTMWCGVNNQIIYSTFNPFFDETLEDYGLENWKAHLQKNPLHLWVSRNEPVEFQIESQPLVQPKGVCNIIQTEGVISNCPISAKYVTHK